EFFGAEKHKLEMKKLLTMDNAVFLDVRSYPEVESLQLKLKHHIEVLHIPIDKIPDRIGEIPRDRTVGIFCSAGTRSAIVYAFLRAKGYENVRVVLGGYEAVASLVLPGKLLKHMEIKKAGE
ncbi:MAG: rhodanese-like domain-containing protein, partial [Deltaproteobacteria bacterium]